MNMREIINLVEAVQAPIPATEENIERAKAFVLKKWIERWHERNPNGPTYNAFFGWDREPTDLSSACKFSSMFAQRVFGGQLRGNIDHQFVKLPDGRILDLNIDAEDVRKLRASGDPHRHDRAFWGNPEHLDAMKSCEPRVGQWVSEFLETLGD